MPTRSSSASHPRLVRDAVEAEAVEPLELKGKSEPVPAYRLDAVLAAPERAHDAPFVGREAEVASIRAAWERASLDRPLRAGHGASAMPASASRGWWREALERTGRADHARPLPALRRGHHVLAGGRGGEQLGALPSIADAAELDRLAAR